jgi:hypothetical protein
MMMVFSFMTGVICILMGLLAEDHSHVLRLAAQGDLPRPQDPNIKSFPKAA